MGGTGVCPHCGRETAETQRFCGGCGGRLGEPTGPEQHEERRWATVVFADLTGFTGLAGQMDPEDVSALVDRCMRRMAEIVQGFGASVLRVIGDQLMAIFGAPLARCAEVWRLIPRQSPMVAGFAGCPLVTAT